jgi:light-regulated signal transduction histidine kinase (bacteriophytochrome)
MRSVPTANVNLEEQAEELSVANTNIEEALVQEHAARAEAEERRRALEQSEREIESLNRDLEMRAAQLEMANKELEAFSYSVSHDLRTPLRAVDNFANLLLQDYGATLDEGARNYMNLIAGNSKQMSELVEGLLRLSRLGRQAVERRSVEPAELVRQVIQDLAPQMEGRTVEVVVDDMPPCLCQLALKCDQVHAPAADG